MGMIIQNGRIFSTGGADNFSIVDVLWSGTAGSAETITLNSNYDNYDLIIFKGYNTNGTTYSSTAFSTNSLELNTNSLLVVDNSTAVTDRRVFAKFTEKNKLTITTAESGSQLKEIIGIKLNGGVSDYHEYSINERIVGKWIDGSTVYERTFVISDLNYSSSGSFKELFTVSDLDVLISMTGRLTNSTKTRQYVIPHITSSKFASIVFEDIAGEGNAKSFFFTSNDTWDDASLLITVHYTKSESNTRSLNLSKGSSDETKSEEPVEEKKSEEVDLKELVEETEDKES